MAAYYVFGILLVAWGLGLSIYGLTRADFPPAGSVGRALVAVTVLLVVGTLTSLLLTTDKEHPREEAAAKAAEAKKETKPPAGQPSPSQGAPAAGGKTVKVSEKEFSIALASGDKLNAGKYTFAVQNVGKIEHDLAIEGGKVKETKTPLIAAGKSNTLSVDLQPGKYTFYCTVPGHEQAGMKVAVTVAGGKQKQTASTKPKPKAKAKPKKKAKPKAAAAKKVAVSEKEFSIALAGGATLAAGSYDFAVKNVGKIQHDLAIEGGKLKETKTPLLDAGKSKDLKVTLKPGKYKFFCTVPGHEQAGMKVDVTVR
jgi:uncharacterized cupredoxin-like copper-binding protein